MRVAYFRATVLEHACGIENYFIEAASGLKKRYADIDISMVTLDDSWYRRFVLIVSVYYLGLSKGRKRKPAYRETSEEIEKSLYPVPYIKCGSFARLRKELQTYDLVYTSNELLDLLVMRLLGTRNMPPVIVGVHTPPRYPYAPSLQARLHNKVFSSFFYRRLLDVSKALHAVNWDDYRRFADRNSYLIFYPFYVDCESPVVGNKSEEMRLLFAGRLMEQKGPDVLVSIIGELSKLDSFRSFRFKIAGDGEAHLREILEDCAAKHDNVEYLGHVPSEEMGEIYEWTDIVLIPSRYETFSRVALEAAAAGKVAIASDIPGLRDEIVDQETGFLVSPDPPAFAQKIYDLHIYRGQEKEGFAGLGRKAKAFAGEKFNPQRVFTELYTMFESEHKSPRGSRPAVS